MLTPAENSFGLVCDACQDGMCDQLHGHEMVKLCNQTLLYIELVASGKNGLRYFGVSTDFVVKWFPRYPGILKCNIDSSCDVNSGRAGQVC